VIGPGPAEAAGLHLGALVMSRDHRSLGIGKIANVANDAATIEYFDSVANPVAERLQAGLDRLVVARLDRQMRVYFRREETWGVGRVLDEELGRVCVRPPGDAPDVWLGVEELFVRWDMPLDDPVAVLRDRAIETPYYYFARRAFVDSMLAEDAAARGNRALTSSAIEIYDHQIAVASRVLADPVRRFLLADEVGMGKTIEAGLVIRQHLLDNPEGSIRVVAPSRMSHQWDRELRDRFFIDDAVLSTVEVLRTEDPAAWRQSREHPVPDLLVIDEAHHVARWAHGSADQQRRFRFAADLAHASTGLLLLSATPVAHNEATYLSMLHLLDPDNYRLDQGEEFRLRVANRHDLARAFVLFRPGQSYRRLHRNADRLRELLGQDENSLGRLDELLELGPDAERHRLDERIRALRVAISDRHRIHYRMLRNRRDEADDFPVRGRRLARTVPTAPEDGFRFADWFDRWKTALAADAADDEMGDWHPVARFVFDRALAFPAVLSAAVAYRLGDQAASVVAEISSVELAAIDAVPPGPEERLALEALAELDLLRTEEARLQHVSDLVWALPRRHKIVVFAGFTATARLITAALESLLDRGQVAAHTAELSVIESEAALRRFRDERSCNVLVCDASAEEGLNLQFADILIHAELPSDPNRLEQRVGRLDRHGPDTPVDNIVLADGYEGSFLDAWLTVLRDGFGVFDRSISSFQFIVDTLLPELTAALIEDGPLGLQHSSASIPERLESERREISEQDQLDAIEAVDLTQPVAGAIRSLDVNWDELQADHEALICTGKGHLRFAREPFFRDDALCSYWSSDPRRGGEPLIPQRDLTAYVLGAVSERGSVRNGSHERAAALRYPGSRVWRAGDPFLDGLLRYVRERDDRGRAYGIWRHSPDLQEGQVVAALRFDLLVQAAPVLPQRSEPERSVLQRRANSLLPPEVETVWIGTDLLEVSDHRLRARLAAKYSPSFGDSRLGIDRWAAVEGALAGMNWSSWCSEARVRAERIVLARDSVETRIRLAAEAGATLGIARVEALRTRQSLRPDSAEALLFERGAAESVVSAVQRPRVEFDAVGLIILAPESAQQTSV
jgi:ATP-dependent helicase HepA